MNTWNITDGGGQTKLKPEDAAIFEESGYIRAVLTPTGPYEDMYVLRELGPLVETDPQLGLTVALVGPNSYEASQGFEFEFHMVHNGKVFNGGMQARLHGSNAGFWHVYNYEAKAWVHTGVPIPPKVQWLAGMWIVASYHCSDTQVVFKSIAVNGVISSIGMTFNAVPTNDRPKFNVAFQLDGVNPPQPITAVLVPTALLSPNTPTAAPPAA